MSMSQASERRRGDRVERASREQHDVSEFVRARVAARVREWLALSDLDLQVRTHGPHVVLGSGSRALARITSLGHEAYGLSFPEPGGRWEMLLVDTLDEVVADFTATLESARTG
jgi:hypothetical protein